MSPFISMVDLPTQLLIEILSRLPVESILICKCVCKLWLDLLSTADFTKLYCSTAPTTLLLQPIDRYNSYKPMKINTRTPCLFHLQDYTNLNADSMLNFKLGTNLPDLGLRLLGSCDGLLCLYDPEANDPVYICNPISRELITLPESSIPTPKYYFDELGFQIHRQFGFGFSSQMSKQYKVIRVVEVGFSGGLRYYHISSCTAEIYTLGEGAWRSLGDVPKFPRATKNIFLNGTLHWDTFEGEHFISFDFDTEQFGTIDGPQLDQNMMEKRSLGVLQGCLSVCNFEDPARLEIWVMKNYGVKKSWTKEYVVELTPDFLLKNSNWGVGEWYDCDLVTILESGEILILFDKCHFVAYDLKLQCFRLLEPFSDEDTSFEAFPYLPNLVSLKDVAAGENIKVCTG